MWHGKEETFVEVDKSGTGFVQTKSRSLQSKNAILKNWSFIMTSWSLHKSLYGTHPEEAINRAKFDASTPESFGAGKTHRQTELRFID